MFYPKVGEFLSEDTLMADERTHLDGSGNIVTDEVLFPLTDQQGTVHDTAKVDASGVTAIVDHIIRDSFGKVVSESDPSQGTLIGYTGRPTDKLTDIEFHDERVRTTGSPDWMSEDPTGKYGGDVNTRRYCFNSPTNMTDPTGLWGDGTGTNGTWPNGVKRGFGHSDFYNPGGYFDFVKEDYGWTSPLLPFWGTPYHFQTLGEAEAELQKALDNHDKNAFERALHDMQDYYSHRKQGWKSFNPEVLENGAAIGEITGFPVTGAALGAAGAWGHAWASARAKAGFGKTPDDAIDYKRDFLEAEAQTEIWVERWYAKYPDERPKP
jgi:RHS repeat-associated protein